MRKVITPLAASSRKRNVTILRPYVCPSVPSASSPWLMHHLGDSMRRGQRTFWPDNNANRHTCLISRRLNDQKPSRLHGYGLVPAASNETNKTERRRKPNHWERQSHNTRLNCSAETASTGLAASLTQRSDVLNRYNDSAWCIEVRPEGQNLAIPSVIQRRPLSSIAIWRFRLSSALLMRLRQTWRASATNC